MLKSTNNSPKYLWQWWRKYFKHNVELLRGTWPTIGRALASWILREAGEARRYKELDNLGKALDQVRGYALGKMLQDGIKIFVHGEHRIEKLSLRPGDKDQHNGRVIRQWQAKTISTERNCYDLDRTARIEYGFLFQKQVKQFERKLLIGDAETTVSVKKD